MTTAIQKALSKLRRLYKTADKHEAAGPPAERKFANALVKADHFAYSIISMPASTVDDMLRKIEAINGLVDCEPSSNKTDWRPKLTGYICDDAPAVLLVALREDLRRLFQS